jgi:benzylsuccinate CoA-transferase BbsF subunit
MSTASAARAAPLAGVRIADFTWIGAGSYATKLLADFGADVIKVETATHMDTLRSTGPFKDNVRGVNRSGYFADRNTSKRGITLNLKHPQGAAIARRLVDKSDIVANNFRPGVMERLGLGYEQARAIRADIIYLAMSMQGSDGPDADYVGFGLTIGALAGLHYLCGPGDRPPAGTGTNFPDHVPNPCHAAFALLAALRHRRRTGHGQYIDLAQTEPTICLQGPALVDYTANGRIAERHGNENPDVVPHGVYPCRGDDRWIAISAHDDAQWAALVAVLDCDARPTRSWASADARLARRAEIDAWIGARTEDRAPYALMHALQAVGVPAGVVQNARDLVADDPQLAHRAHWQYLEHSEMGRTIFNNVPVHLSRTPGSLSRPAPLLGEHTEEICTGLLGYSAAEYARFAADGVFE